MSAGKGRIEKELRFRIAEALLESQDPRLGLVTVLEVKLSKDKKYARVHYTTLEEGGQLRATQRALDAGKGHIQEHLAEHVVLRHTPILDFYYDRSIAESFRMKKILDDISKELGTTPEDPLKDYEVCDPEELGAEGTEPPEASPA